GDQDEEEGGHIVNQDEREVILVSRYLHRQEHIGHGIKDKESRQLEAQAPHVGESRLPASIEIPQRQKAVTHQMHADQVADALRVGMNLQGRNVEEDQIR